MIYNKPEMIIDRNIYLDNFDFLLKSEQIKIINGPRRCGKSFLLNQLAEKAKAKGIKEDHIIQISMEEYEYDDLRKPDVFHKYVVDKIKDTDRYYIFIDEVQYIGEWERVINSLRLKNTSIFVTGSNSTLLWGKLATLLSGRYIQHKLTTVPFSEYWDSVHKNYPHTSLEKAFKYYEEVGSYPIVLAETVEKNDASITVKDIFASTMYRDVIQKYDIRDPAFLNDLMNFMIDNTGHYTSIRKIVAYLSTHQHKTNFITVNNYIKALMDAFMLEKVNRYDVRGKMLLNTIDKYYLVDHSYMYFRKGQNREYMSQVYENIVYNELKARGYDVYIGKVGDYEIDFIAQKREKKLYIQVCQDTTSPSTTEREERPLRLIEDNHPKYIVTMSQHFNGNNEGIKYVYLPEFLISKDW